MSIKFHMTFWRTIILSLFTQLQKYVLKETFGIEKQFYLWKCFQTKAVFSTFYTYSANDNKLIFSKYIIFGLIYNIDSFVTVHYIDDWPSSWLSVVVLSIVSYETINCVANQKHSKLLSFVQLSFSKVKFYPSKPEATPDIQKLFCCLKSCHWCHLWTKSVSKLLQEKEN